MLFGIINVYAVIVAAVVAMLIGGFWYSPLLFGKKWMRLRGLKSVSSKEMQMPPAKMLVEFICTIVMAFVLSVFVSLVPATLPTATALYAGIVIALFIWVGFYVTALLAEVLWEDKPFGVFLITASVRLINLVVMAMILAYWR